MKTKKPEISKDIQENVKKYIASHERKAGEDIEGYFRTATKEVLKKLPPEVQEERYKALATSLLVNEDSSILSTVLGAGVSLPTIDDIVKKAPPKGETAKAVFEELTDCQLDEDASKRLNRYLNDIVRDRIKHSVHHKVEKATQAVSGQKPDNASILGGVLEDILQPSGFMVSYSPSYHGATAGTLGMRDKPGLYFEKTFGSDRILFASTPHPYRQQGDGESEQEYVARLLREVEQKILSAGGKGNVAAILVEPVSGSSLGGVPLPKGYLEGLRALSEKYGPEDGKILLIYDEVMCGMGRTGKFAAFQHPDIAGEKPTDPDIILYSKAIHSGAEQDAAVVFNPEVMADMNKNGVHIEYSTTTMNFPPAAAAVLETIKQLYPKISSGDLQRQGEKLVKKITELTEASDILRDHIGQIRGFGHMLGIELVNNKQDKEQIDAKANLHLRIYEKALLEEGLGTLPVGACRNTDGTLINSDTVFLLPTYIMKDIDMDRMAKRLVSAMEKVIAEVTGVSLPEKVVEPLEEQDVMGVIKAIQSYKPHYHDHLKVTAADGNNGVEVEFYPRADNENDLRDFRKKFMQASGGYISERSGDNWLFHLTADQARDVLAYEKAVGRQLGA